MLYAINEILSWTLLFVLLWNGYILLFNKGVPNIRTAPAIRKKVIEILKEDRAARGKDGYTIIDMGSGSGRFSRQMARSMPEARITGIEWSRLAYWYTSMCKRLFRLENLDYKRADFFGFDVSRADAIVMYLTIYEMGRMGQKLNRELKEGTLVISNRFRLGDGWEPDEVLHVKTLYPHQKQLHIYRKRAAGKA